MCVSLEKMGFEGRTREVTLDAQEPAYGRHDSPLAVPEACAPLLRMSPSRLDRRPLAG